MITTAELMGLEPIVKLRPGLPLHSVDIGVDEFGRTISIIGSPPASAPPKKSYKRCPDAHSCADPQECNHPRTRLAQRLAGAAGSIYARRPQMPQPP